MNRLTIFTFFVLVTMFLSIQANGSIVIDISDDNLQRFGEILVQHYVDQQLSAMTMSTKSLILPKVKVISRSVLKMFAVMLTLVGANLLTSLFEFSNNNSNNQITNQIISNVSINFCDHFDFGCEKNICWRVCEKQMDSVPNIIAEKNKSTNALISSWCFTSSNPDQHEFQHCVYDHDCSPCWKCLGSCESPSE